MQHIRHGQSVLLAALIALALLSPALPASYPVSGRWTYDYSSEIGPAARCGPRRMEFRGARRLDTGGGVPDYRNVSVAPAGSGRYRIVEEFFNGQARGNVHYLLRLIDRDRIALILSSGQTIRLRRCA